jgi:hypothetical protein
MSLEISSEDGLSLEPHSPQNLVPNGIVVLHAGHVVSSFDPHSSQNFIPGRIVEWHFEHLMIYASIRFYVHGSNKNL